jgi:putative transcriptional regulator
MDSLQGHLLIASSELVDPNFFRAVVLLVRHSEAGALGLVLNRRSQTTLREVWKQVRQTECHREGHLDLGGPCQGPLTALHTDVRCSDSEVLPGLYFTGEPGSLEQLATADDAQPARFFVGYAGWGAGQLEGELETGSWRVMPAAIEQILAYDPDLWDEVTKQLVGQWMAKSLNLRHVPPDLSCN